MTKHQSPQELLPLTPPVFHIFARVGRGGTARLRHYAGRRTTNRWRAPTRSRHALRCLKRMLAAGLVEESGERPDPALDDQRRRYYRMTVLGKRMVRAEAQRLAGAVTVAMARLAGESA